MVEQYPHQLFIDQTPEMSLDENGNWQQSEAPYSPQIGDHHFGGIVAYIDNTWQHGFVCSESDISTGIAWRNGTSVQTLATGQSIGEGSENTTKIIQIQGIGSYAASICKLYNGGSYTDWVLPSIDELLAIAENNLLDDYRYWSSTEDSPDYDSAKCFDPGFGNFSIEKFETLRVRAIRYF